MLYANVCYPYLCIFIIIIFFMSFFYFKIFICSIIFFLVCTCHDINHEHHHAHPYYCFLLIPIPHHTSNIPSYIIYHTSYIIRSFFLAWSGLHWPRFGFSIVFCPLHCRDPPLHLHLHLQSRSCVNASSYFICSMY